MATTGEKTAQPPLKRPRLTTMKAEHLPVQELKKRSAKRFRETFKEVPSETVDKLIASFVLPLTKDMPGSMEPLDEVIFVELSRDNTQRILDYLRHSSFKIVTNVSSTSIASVFGWQSASGSSSYQTQSSLKAPNKQPIHPISAKKQSTSIGSVSGWQSTSKSSGYQMQSRLVASERYPIHPLGARGCLNTTESKTLIQSSSNAPGKHLIQPVSAKDGPLDEDFVLFRTFDLYEEYESMDIQHGTLTELSNSAESTQDDIDALWDMFRARINKCREIRREIRSAGGSPPPIPEWFLT